MLLRRLSRQARTQQHLLRQAEPVGAIFSRSLSPLFPSLSSRDDIFLAPLHSLEESYNADDLQSPAGL